MFCIVLGWFVLYSVVCVYDCSALGERGVVLCCSVLCCVVLCCIVLYRIDVYGIALYCNVSCLNVLCNIGLHCLALCCRLLDCLLLASIVGLDWSRFSMVLSWFVLCCFVCHETVLHYLHCIVVYCFV